MTPFQLIRAASPSLATKIEAQHFFLRMEDVRKIAEVSRLTPLLVRCGGGRFTAPAQDVEHFVDIIDREKSDYLRDISIQNN